MIVVTPPATLSCSATCDKYHTLLPYKKEVEDNHQKKKKKKGFGIRFTNSVIERDTKDGKTELREEVVHEVEPKHEGPPLCASCGTLFITLVCRECYFHLCDDCNEVLLSSWSLFVFVLLIALSHPHY